ncbi:uncharacterized protein AB675_1591 [Cyphellophora attinorum]|uniref:Serum paraoxonase/arylesterase 2 n=1 Tax=Cyphellophora attinorum TaxID=1664694 RepID=A0A0N1H0F7_9EURO|nr:uncharacterized protein AB675_1591 [Phialophora attinorum]KPI37197.1 hypothetical protein AB675_1591 [Phialophora attinorum]
MPSLTTWIGFTVLNLAILWQFLLKNIVFNSFGYGRVLQPLSDFPYTCRRVTDHNIAACEDAWIDDKSRQLFLACSNALGRKAWNPTMASYAADRRPQHDQVVVMSLDTPHPQDPQSFDYRILDFGDYTNAIGEKQLNLLGMTGRTLKDGTINLYFVSQAPTFDLTTQVPTDQAVTGHNATIEAFSMSPDSSTLKHLYTFYNPTNITTPNNVAVRPDDSIVITNDHGPYRSGLGHTLSTVLGTGSIAHCIPPPDKNSIAPCSLIAKSERHHFPNGLHVSPKDTLLYVPSSLTGEVSVYSSPFRYENIPQNGFRPFKDADHLHNTTQEHPIHKVGSIPLNMPLDNISEDSDGVMLVAGFPKLPQVEEHLKESTPIDGRSIAATILEIRRVGEPGKGFGMPKREWTVKKILEDPKGEILPMTTTAVRDAKTGRLFIMGVVSPWIAVCDPK